MANVHENKDISFSDILYDKSAVFTFNDDFNIKMFDSQGNLKFSQYIVRGQHINYWGKLLTENLNKANIKVGDYFTITNMKSNKVSINGKDIDPSKEYVFGSIGVFPR